MTVPMEEGKVVWIPKMTKHNKLEWIEKEYANRIEDIAIMLAYTHELEERLGIDPKYIPKRPLFTERFLLLRSDLFHKLTDTAQERERKRYFEYREWQKTQLRNDRKTRQKRSIEAEVDAEEAAKVKPKRVRKVKLTPRAPKKTK